MATVTEQINELFGIKESFELPTVLLDTILNNDKRIQLVEKFKSMGFDADKDILRDYFQLQNSDRKNFKQDYTPDSICELMSAIVPSSKRILDVCGGTGSLTIALRQDANYQIEELSSMSIPVLLFNLSIRQIRANVIQKDVLTKEIKKIYKVHADGMVTELEQVEELQPDLVISNPPYSLQWIPTQDDRFSDYPLAPKSKADYAFILDAVYRTTDKAFIILPHGVLFRGQSENEIRKLLIEKNLISAVIGLPNNMFLNTQIPVFILVIDKHKPDNKILFVDGSKRGKKVAKFNVLEKDTISLIADVFKNRKEIEKLSRVVDIEEVRKNDYNLNIPRYVDNSEDKEQIDIESTVNDIIELNMSIKKTNTEIVSMLKSLIGSTEYENQMSKIIDMLEKENELV